MKMQVLDGHHCFARVSRHRAACAPTHRRQRVPRAVYVPDDTAVNTGRGPSLQQWTQTPADIIALGPRATAGALSSLSQLQQDLERINMLLQDPRPFDQKQGQLSEEVQATVATYVERGAQLEAEVLRNIGSSLPEDFKSALPLELRDALAGGTGPAVTSSQPGASSTPVTVQEPVGKASLIDYQTAAEMVSVRSAVEGVRDAVTRLGANEQADQEGVLKLNLSERRDALSRSIAQLSPGTLSLQDRTVIAAVSEASQLLAEIDSLPKNF